MYKLNVIQVPIEALFTFSNNPGMPSKSIWLQGAWVLDALYPKSILYLNSSPGALIDDIVDEASSIGVTNAPEWGLWDNKQFNNSGKNKNYYHTILQKQAFTDIINNGFRERLTLFWSNHFVVEYKDVNQPAYLYQYYALIQTHALGNFKTFVSEIGLSPAMLRYLNGYENKKNNPNEKLMPVNCMSYLL